MTPKQESFTSNEGHSHECDDVSKQQSLISNKGNPQRVPKRQKCPDEVERKQAPAQKMVPQDRRGKGPNRGHHTSQSALKFLNTT